MSKQITMRLSSVNHSRDGYRHFCVTFGAMEKIDAAMEVKRNPSKYEVAKLAAVTELTKQTIYYDTGYSSYSDVEMTWQGDTETTRGEYSSPRSWYALRVESRMTGESQKTLDTIRRVFKSAQLSDMSEPKDVIAAFLAAGHIVVKYLKHESLSCAYAKDENPHDNEIMAQDTESLSLAV